MNNNELKSMCVFYAISPIHAGSGSSLTAVDLPIQRERHTGYPHVQATGIKGAFRACYRLKANSGEEKLINQIFGSDEQDGWDRNSDPEPGAFAVSDAKLLAFPVRSNIAPFVRVTSPSILKRLNTDLDFLGMSPIDEVNQLNIIKDNALYFGNDFNEVGDVLLEDAVVTKLKQAGFQMPQALQNLLGERLNKLLIISDEMFDYVVMTCTEIQTNIKIDSETGTTKDGSLRYQEFLPADTILYSIFYYEKQLAGSSKPQPAEVKRYIESNINYFIQIGGDNSVGKGICKIYWFPGGEK